MIRSFKYAFLGIWHCLRYERSMRIHLVIALYALYFSKYYAFGKLEYTALCVPFAIVICAEMVNTSIEQLVDIKTDSFDLRAKAAKDIAAGAVCVCAIFAVIIGLILYLDFDIIKFIALDHIANPIKLIGLLTSAVLSVVFVKYGLARKDI